MKHEDKHQYEERYERGEKWGPIYVVYDFPTKDKEYWLDLGLMVRNKVPFLRTEVYKWIRKK